MSASFTGTREEWCYRVIQVLERELAAMGITMQGDRQVRIAVTPLPASKLGECHSANKAADGRTNFIDICTSQPDPQELVHTLLHELLHAFDNCNSGHRGRWRRWADAIQIKRAGHSRGPIAQRMVDAALLEVGEPAEHVSSVRWRTAAQQASQVKLTCLGCGLYAYMPRGRHERGDARLECVTCRMTLASGAPA
jgi:hypothetical protein